MPVDLLKKKQKDLYGAFIEKTVNIAPMTENKYSNNKSCTKMTHTNDTLDCVAYFAYSVTSRMRHPMRFLFCFLMKQHESRIMNRQRSLMCSAIVWYSTSCVVTCKILWHFCTHFHVFCVYWRRLWSLLDRHYYV